MSAKWLIMINVWNLFVYFCCEIKLKRRIWCKIKIKFENWCNSTLIFISFAIVGISSGPPFLKSSVTLLRLNVFAGQSPTFPTIKPIRIYTFRIFTWDVDRKKDHDRPYLNHLGKNSGAPNVNFWGKYLFGRRSEIYNFWNICCKISCSPASPRIFEHLEKGIIAHFERIFTLKWSPRIFGSLYSGWNFER